MLAFPALLAVSLGGLTGCLSSISQTSARTLDKGQTEFTGSIGAVVLPPEDYAPPALPLAQVQVRHGLTDRVEIAGALSPSNVGARLKLGLVRSESETSGFSLSLEPGAGVYFLPTQAFNGAVEVSLPLYLGVRFGGGHEFTFGPRVGAVGPMRGGPWNPVIGGTAAFAFKVTDNFMLTPEIGLLTYLGAEDGTTWGPSFGLGFTWGR